MSAWALALRNLLRNGRRSATTLFAIIIGAVCMLLFGGYTRNITYGLQTEIVRGSGHLQVQRRDYFLYGAGSPIDYSIRDYQHVIQTLRTDPVLARMVTVVTPVLQLGGIAGNYAAGVSRTVFARGTVVEDQNRMRRWNDYGIPGGDKSLALTNTSSDAAVVGKGLARVLRADHPGAQVEMLAATAHGAPNVAELTVVKAEDQGVKELDDAYVGLHLSQAQQLIYGRGEPEVTAIEVQLAHTRQTPEARRRIEELLAGPLRGEPLEVHDFATLNPFYGQTLGLFAAIFGFISILIGAIVLFTVGNTMSMAVVERTVEIGTLRAIGLRRGGIRRLFLCEGVLLGLSGALLGVLVSLGLATLINHAGLTWTPPGRVDPVRLHIRVWGETSLVLVTAIILMLVAVISAWWPARRAARMDVVEALRHV